MTTEIIRIGNSRGIRTPEPILEQCGLTDTVEGDTLRLTRGGAPRAVWEDVFRYVGVPGGDELLLSGVRPNVLDLDE